MRRMRGTARSDCVAHVMLLLLLVCISISSSTAADGRWCTEAGELLEQQEQWEAAVDAYLNCSSEQSSQGPVAAWSMYRAFNVLHWQLHDTQRALAACEAGWSAEQAPELAWCAGLSSYFLQRYSDAKQWAERAIALGCFSGGGGSCQPLIARVPAHSKLPVQSCSWESPYDVLAWAHRGLRDAAAEAEARQQWDEARRARETKGRPAPSAAAAAVMLDNPHDASEVVSERPLAPEAQAGDSGVAASAGANTDVPAAESCSLPQTAKEAAYTTLVTGFFSTPGNTHRQLDTYLSWMREFLPVIRTPMVIYTSTDLHPLLAGMRGDLPAVFKAYGSVWELDPAREFRQVFEQQRAVNHTEWQAHKGCTAAECSVVWNSKPWMVAQAAADNVFNSSYFMWVDIASFRWGQHSLQQWPSVEHVQELAQHEAKVAIEVVALPTNISVFGQAVPHFVAGTWFGGSQAAVGWFADAFLDVLRRRHALGLYVAQEQSMMDSLLLMQPDRFVVLHDEWVWDGGVAGWRRAYEAGPGSANCSVWWYMQFQVQLASQCELLAHASTAGCQRVPYRSLQPVAKEFVWRPVDE